VATIDRARACLTCSCPGLRTYRAADAYCSACGHPAAQHGAAPDEQDTAPIHEEKRVLSSLRELAPVPSSLHQEEQAPSLIQDEVLESGWRAVLPSGLFFSVAIAAAGTGLIVGGLAMRFKELLAAPPWW